jgi:phosphoribosyl 1,2-cyclic phosphodiesterase
MRFTSLGSGSSGNALVVESGKTRVMMDCGFGIAETKARVEIAGLVPGDLAAIVVTHEHDDHLGGVAAFAKKYAIPVYLTRGTAQWLPEGFPAVLVRLIDSHTPFVVDGLAIDPFSVPTRANRCSSRFPTGGAPGR